MHISVAVGLLGADGQELPLHPKVLPSGTLESWYHDRLSCICQAGSCAHSSRRWATER